MSDFDTRLSDLPPEEKARRSGSFGSAAADYDRYRPGPSVESVEWILGERWGTVVDLGAGTGTLTRRVVGRADRVIAVEPDDRMRAVLAAELPGVEALAGRAEAMPLGDGSVDAVVASSSWHWVDPRAALAEMARVLRPGGVLGAVWVGADPNGPLMAQLQHVLAGGVEGGETPFSAAMARHAPHRDDLTLTIPPGLPFDPVEQRYFVWEVAMTLDDVVGLLGTFSWMLVLPEDERAAVLADARAAMGPALGIGGDQTVDLAFRCDAYRTHLRR